MQRLSFPPMSLLFVAADAYGRSFCECFSVANVNSFLSPNRMKITSFSNCFEQPSLARQFASISYPAGVSVNTSNQAKNDHVTPDCAI